ncbi:MAG: dienelactone hydrolase family protein [Candidatus Rokuibacteriota bacterium]|nr:MAG: dienelactone hydrolase family protein [Candidatus Rokubacteria bacterium]
MPHPALVGLVVFGQIMGEPAPRGAAASPARVAFPSEPRNIPRTTRLDGVLYRPPGPGRHPAVVMLHGCGGLWTRARAVQAKPAFWAEHLAARGYVVLLVDSFGPRGIDEICTGRRSLSTEKDRADDARGALRYLQALPDVRADRVGLLGWSNGAGAALSVLFDRGDLARDFRAAVAFYPSCLRRYPGGPDYRPYAPLLVLIGAADDWTPAAPCVTWAGRARALGAPMEIHVYQGAYHSFDAPDSPVRYRADVRNRSKPGGSGGAHVGTDPAARADAIGRVTRFFGTHLGGAAE